MLTFLQKKILGWSTDSINPPVQQQPLCHFGSLTGFILQNSLAMEPFLSPGLSLHCLQPGEEVLKLHIKIQVSLLGIELFH